VTWDGVERRTPQPQRWEAWQVLLAVLLATVAIFEGAALLGHRTLADRQADNSEKDETFRRTVSCFLVEITQPEADADRVDILTRCGLVGTIDPGDDNQ
jgi:hypothetical protein